MSIVCQTVYILNANKSMKAKFTIVVDYNAPTNHEKKKEFSPKSVNWLLIQEMVHKNYKRQKAYNQDIRI